MAWHLLALLFVHPVGGSCVPVRLPFLEFIDEDAMSK